MILDSKLDMEKFIPNKQFRRVFRAVEKHGGVLRFVGGAVRDALAGVEGYDYDLATDLSPDELMEACNDEGIKTVPIGIKFGTLGVMVNDKLIEITSLRKDIKTDGRHAEVEFTDDWLEDAARRDLTINAVYADEKGNVFDYFNGIEDLKNGIIHFIGKPEQRIEEDYLRILRFFRFYSKFGKTAIDEKALNACIKNKDNLKKLSIERIRDELIKLARTKNFAKTLKIMFDNGILDYVMPPSNNLDKLQHLIDMVSDLKIEPSVLRRLFILYNPNDHLAGNLADRMHLSKKHREYLMRLAKVECKANDFNNNNFIRELIYRYDKDFCLDKLLIAYALEKKNWQNVPDILKKIQNMQIPSFPVRGQDIVGLAKIPEKFVGVIIHSLENYWISHEFAPNKDNLLKVAESMFISLINIHHHG